MIKIARWRVNRFIAQFLAFLGAGIVVSAFAVMTSSSTVTFNAVLSGPWLGLFGGIGLGVGFADMYDKHMDDLEADEKNAKQ